VDTSVVQQASNSALLKTASGRLRFAGVEMYGPDGWTTRLARGLGISRSTLFEWRQGRHKHGRDIDGEIVDLIDRERDAVAARGMQLTRLRNMIIKAAAKDSK